MSKKERLATSFEQLSDLCFTISGLVIEDSSEGGEIAKPSSSTLSPAAPVFKPVGKETSTPENKGSLLSDSESLEDWESVPELPSVSRDTLPTFSQVVGNSQSVCYRALTLVRLCLSVQLSLLQVLLHQAGKCSSVGS